MKNLILLILISTSLFSCAKRTETVCQIFFKFDEQGHRTNGFWFIEGNYEVHHSQCDRILPDAGTGAK